MSVLRKAWQSVAGTVRRGLSRAFAEAPAAEMGRAVSEMAKNLRGMGAYNPDQLVAKHGSLKVYKDMLREPYVKAALFQKKFKALATPWQILPASEDPGDLEVAEFVRWTLENVHGNFTANLLGIQDALDCGYSISEIVLKVLERGPWVGKWGIDRIKAKDPDLYEFDTDEFLNVRGLKLTLDGKTTTLDPAGFIVWSFLPRYEDPHGSSDLRAAYRAFWIKDNVWRFRAIYLERYCGGNIVGRYSRGATEKEQLDLLAIVRAWQSQTGVIVPEDVIIESIQIATSASDAYRSALEDLNQELAVSILGSFLTIAEGKLTGSRAGGEVHRDTADIFTTFLQWMLAEVVNEQIVRPLVDKNFDGVDEYPWFTFEQPEEEQSGLEDTYRINTVLKAAQVVDVPQGYIYDRFGIPRPKDGEPVVVPPAPDPAGGGAPEGFREQIRHFSEQGQRLRRLAELEALDEETLAGGRAAVGRIVDAVKKKSNRPGRSRTWRRRSLTFR